MTTTATSFNTVPSDVKVKILRRVAGSAHPRLELPSAAADYGLTVEDVREICNRHGGIEQSARLIAAAKILEENMAYEAKDGLKAPEGADGSRLMKVRVADLIPDPDNVRKDLGDLVELADSITAVGLLQPIVARRHEGRLIVVAGHRRLGAVKLLHWDTVACIVRGDMRPDHVLAAMLIENGQRADLDPIEEARGLARLKGQRDCSDTELGRMIGRSQAYVSNRLALLSLSTEQQDQVRAGRMSITEGTHKGRVASGRIGSKGVDRNWHLSVTHNLAEHAKARCLRLGHSRNRIIGAMACGECWEAVIREDERRLLKAEGVEW